MFNTFEEMKKVKHIPPTLYVSCTMLSVKFKLFFKTNKRICTQDLPGVIQRTADFLDRTLSSGEMSQLCEHLSFESMKNNRSVSHEDEMAKLRGKETNLIGKIEPFMRKGVVGGWKQEITPQIEEKLNLYTKEKLAGTEYEMNLRNSNATAKFK